MQALTPEENRAVQAHLDGCAECRAALADVMADVALVGMSVEQQALPNGARQRLWRESRIRPRLRCQRLSRRQPSTEIPAREERVAGSRFGWLGWVAAAATLAIAAYLGNNNFKLQQQVTQDGSQIAQLSAQSERAQELMDALTSPAAKQVTLTESKQPLQPVGHARYVQKTGALIFVASNLHPVASDKTYELWLIPANGKAPIHGRAVPSGCERQRLCRAADSASGRRGQGLRRDHRRCAGRDDADPADCDGGLGVSLLHVAGRPHRI